MRRGRKIVLVVDADAHARHVDRAYLESHGYVVYEASNGVVAYRRAMEVRPDLIILSHPIVLEVGVSLVRAFRASPLTARTPLLNLARQLETERVETDLNAMNLWLPAPLPFPELLAAVQRLIGP